MADAEQSDRNTSAPHRRPYYQNQNRPAYSYRGRGRPNPSVSKALHFFGVRDLREILDRKHQEQEQASGPPPDPSYTYLKDPLRENAHEYQTHRHYKEQHLVRHPSDFQHRGRVFRGSRGRGRGSGRYSETEKTAYIKNPANIKVELIASTGERNCKLDEETKLDDIKHVPNHQMKDLRPPKNDSGASYVERNRDERGRGWGQRGRRGRGRWERGRGRGLDRYNSNRSRGENNENTRSSMQKPPEVLTEENWDTDCVGASTHESQNEINPEDNPIETQGEQEIDYREYYDGEEEYYEANVQDDATEDVSNVNLEEGISNLKLEDDNVNLEENFVVTSSPSEEKQKRTVKFKLNDARNPMTGDQKLKTGKDEKKSGKDEISRVKKISSNTE